MHRLDQDKSPHVLDELVEREIEKRESAGGSTAEDAAERIERRRDVREALRSQVDPGHPLDPQY